MPSYKHVSKKAARRRRKQFESSFMFRFGKVYSQASMFIDRLGQHIAESADAATKALAALTKSVAIPNRHVIGVDPAAPNGNSEATVIVEHDGDISKVVGVLVDNVKRAQWPVELMQDDPIKWGPPTESPSASEINASARLLVDQLASNVREHGLRPRVDESVTIENIDDNE